MTNGIRDALRTIALCVCASVAPARAMAQGTTGTAVATADSSRALTRVALAALLADASKRNVLPPSLIAYKARVETEIAVLLRREEGTEVVTAVEQVASGLRWTRGGYYDQHVIGYRNLMQRQ